MAKSSTQSNKAIKVGVITDQTGPPAFTGIANANVAKMVERVLEMRQTERQWHTLKMAGRDVARVGNLMTRRSIQWAEGASNKPLVADAFKSS